MKTAEEWRLEYLQQAKDANLGKHRTLVFGDDSFVKAIQLDAMREGMRRAAKNMQSYSCVTVSPEMDPVAAAYEDGVDCASEEIHKLILSAAEQLNEKDLI